MNGQGGIQNMARHSKQEATCNFVDCFLSFQVAVPSDKLGKKSEKNNLLLTYLPLSLLKWTQLNSNIPAQKYSAF